MNIQYFFEEKDLELITPKRREFLEINDPIGLNYTIPSYSLPPKNPIPVAGRGRGRGFSMPPSIPPPGFPKLNNNSNNFNFGKSGFLFKEKNLDSSTL